MPSPKNNFASFISKTSSRLRWAASGGKFSVNARFDDGRTRGRREAARATVAVLPPV